MSLQFIPVLLALACCLATSQSTLLGESRYDALEPGRFLGAVRLETVIPGEAVFSEGPAVDREGLVYFTNIPAELILRWDPVQRALSPFRHPSGQANGLRFDPQGRLLVCEGGNRQVTRIDLETRLVSVLASAFNNFPLAAPNDLDYDSMGRIYFSSRPGVPDPEQGNVNAVYRIDPNGRVRQVLAYPEIHMPNGVVVSPDDSTLYVIEAHSEANHHRDLRAYPIKENGNLGEPTIIYDFYPGRSGDGMCIDQQGNLYVAAGLHATRGTSETLDTRPGIHVISPSGRLLDFVETPEDTVTNCTFGGKDLRTLYVTCGRKLLSLRTQIAGKASYRPR